MEKQQNVSLFPNLRKFETEETSLQQVITRIKEGYWERALAAYRAARASGNQKQAAWLKSNLPGFTPSGVFRGGHRAGQMAAYNQVIGLDFDDVAEPEALRNVFLALPTTLALFVSPSANGLKVFVRVDSPAEQHATAYRQVAAAYEEAGGVQSDLKCKDISRCCYVSHDPQAVYREDAAVFHVTRPADACTLDGAEMFVKKYFDWNPPFEGNRNQTVYNLGCAANRRGFPEAEIARICRLRLQSDSFGANEIERALHSAYQGNSNEYGNHMRANGHKADTTDTATFRDMPSDSDAFEEEGEDLRGKTPFLPRELAGSLPLLLQKALEPYDDRREYDMALLAACGVLSACLPGVSGTYRQKTVNPNLFVVEVAPPANGKGCIDDMRRLAERYEALLRLESEREEQEYLQALEEWEVKKTEAHHRKQAVRVGDAPVKVAVCHLLIPAQVTKARLLQHLADNGQVGGLIIDSEIDTLLNASRQDYGLFDDILRKAFHHEPISSSRKTDNEYTRILHPCLSLVLAGTPAQFSRLVPNAENGLMSRLMLYTCRSAATWQDVSPREGVESVDTRMARLSEEVMEMACRLRKQPLKISLTRRQWSVLNLRFAHLLEETDCFGDDDFLSVIKRYGLMTYRLCMLFTALEVAYGKEDIPVYATCSDVHFEAALAIALISLEHSRLLMTQLRPAQEHPDLRVPLKYLDIFSRLPEYFTLQEFYTEAAVLGISERSIRRLLNRLIPKYITKIAPGNYQKNSSAAA